MLIHQLPPKPSAFRVRIWKRLGRLGAVALKSSVYVLPKSDQAQEDLQWVLREILTGGGEATLCEARLVEGLSDEQVEALFQAARDADYAQLAEEARRLGELLPARPPLEEALRAKIEPELSRLERRLAEVDAIDFFGAPGREIARGLVSGLEARLRALTSPPVPAPLPDQQYRDRCWVTRTGIHIDRIGSAWLIRRFIDPGARFSFVPPKGYRPEPGELRFDMFEAEFTHEGELCTFEVLARRFAPGDAALQALAEIVHDIDLKEQKFGRPETAGLAHLIAGMAMLHRDDEVRLSQGSALFEDLYTYFQRKGD
jgi:hypothetical protein